MLNQLGSGSTSCLTPAVETERLMRSNERQDRSVLFFVNLQLQAPCSWICSSYPQVAAIQPGIIYQ